MSTLIGTAVGRYQLETLLGVGGMAEVYRGVDTELGRTVAVKVVLPAIAAQREFRERFSREARLVAALTHPNIAPIYDVGEHQGLPFLVMPFFAGGSLAARLEGKPLAAALIRRWLGDLARALDAAHAAGVLHRDVKPSNVLIDAHGQALLADFGVALAANAQTRLTTTGAVVGTPGYMAPELAMGEPATPASDRYSLAVLAYELVTGRVPFSGESAIAVLHQHATRPVPPLAERLPRATEDLDRVLRQALAKRPEERPATALAFADALDAALLGFPEGEEGEAASSPTRRLETSPIAPPGPARGSGRTDSSAWRWLGMAALVAAGTFGGLALWRGLEPSLPEVERVAANLEPMPALATPSTAPPPELEPSRPAAAQSVETRSVETRSVETPPVATPSAQTPPAEAQATGISSTSAPAETPGQPPDQPSGEVSALRTNQLPVLGGRPRFPGQRQREWARQGQRLTAADFAEMATRASALSGRPVEAARARSLATFARGGTAYLEGRFEEAGAAVDELLESPGLVALGGGPGPLPLLVLKERTPGTPLAGWELALAYSDARGEGLAALDAALAAAPEDSRLLVGRAYLHRLDGDHAAALADARSVYETHGGRRAGVVAQFIAEEHAALHHYQEALTWYRAAVAEGGRMAIGAALEGARLAEEQLRDKEAAIELLTSACKQGQIQACRRAQRLKSGF